MPSESTKMISLERLELYDDLIKGEIQEHAEKIADDQEAGHVVVDNSVTEMSENPVSSSAIYAQLAGKANTNHNHNDSYYTKSQVDDLVAGATISDATMDAINAAIAEKADASDLQDHIEDTSVHITAEERGKLSSIENGAEPNVIEVVKRNGQALPVTDKAVDVEVPTKLSDLADDVGYVTDADISAELAGKANVSHTHSTSDVAGLEAQLGNKYGTTSTARQNEFLAAPANADGLIAPRKVVIQDLPTGTTADTVALGAHVHDVSDIQNMPMEMKSPHPLNLQINGELVGSFDGDVEMTYNVSKGALGLDNVNNTADADKVVKEAGKLTNSSVFQITGAATAAAKTFNGTQDVNLIVTEVAATALYVPTGDTLIIDGSF